MHEHHERPHSETSQPPEQRWAAGGWLPRMPDSLEQLDLLLLTVARPRVVHRDGVHCQGLRDLDLTLSAYVGEQVEVRYDPRDLVEIRIYHHRAFLCRGVAPELAAATISRKDLQTARTRRRQELRGQLTQQRSLADALTANTRTSPTGGTPHPTQTPREPDASESGVSKPGAAT